MSGTTGGKSTPPKVGVVRRRSFGLSIFTSIAYPFRMAHHKFSDSESSSGDESSSIGREIRNLHLSICS